MKKGILSLCALLPAGMLLAQEPADALRFSNTNPSGTARQQAIGGAMGSLGGDFTATYVNPAGLGFYRTGDFTFTPAYHWSKTKASYIDRKEESKDRRFDFGALGVVLSNGHPTRNIALSFGLSTQADFRKDLLYRGQNNQSSYSQRFIEELKKAGVKDATAAYMFPFGSSLALNTYWLDPVRDTSGQVTGFRSNSPVATGLLQEQSTRERGGIYEAAIGIGAQVNDKLFIGGTLGIPILFYNRESTFTEADATNDTSNHFDFAEYRERLTTSGVGLNIKLGAIYKPAEFWRLGLALHSPTLYSLTDRFDYDLTTNTEGYQGEFTDYSKDYNEGSQNRFKYRMTTPWKAIGSVSFVLRETQDITRQRGFITADVEYVHYPGMRYFTDNDPETEDAGNKDYFKELNQAIKDQYQGAFNFRAGAELKFSTWMVRAGGAYFGNPYKEVNGGKGSRVNVSGGLGYRNKGIYIDLTYVHSIEDDIHTPYRLSSAPYYVANTNRVQGNVLLSFGVKF